MIADKESFVNKNIFISSNIEFLRKKNKLTQEKLGSKLGYNYTAIGNWEKGIRLPNIIDLYKLSKIFNVSVDDLLTKNLKLENNK